MSLRVRSNSKTSVTLFGADYSVYTRTVRLALEEKGVSYRFQPIDIFSASGPPADYLDRHPFARIPTFEHEGFRLYEAGAISRYVDEAFPGSGLHCDAPQARARMNQIMSLIDSYAYRSLVWDVFFERVRVPQKGGRSDEGRIEAGLATAGICLSAISELRGDDAWLAGSKVSLADLHAYPILVLFRLAPEGQELFKTYPALSEWYKAFGERESALATRHPLETSESE